PHLSWPPVLKLRIKFVVTFQRIIIESAADQRTGKSNTSAKLPIPKSALSRRFLLIIDQIVISLHQMLGSNHRRNAYKYHRQCADYADHEKFVFAFEHAKSRRGKHPNPSAS